MLSNSELDKIWFKHMYHNEKYTIDELANMDCIHESVYDIANIIGVKYKKTKSAKSKVKEQAKPYVKPQNLKLEGVKPIGFMGLQ